MNKKTIYIAITLIILAVLAGIAYRIYDYIAWQPRIERNANFIETWGTYSHQDFTDYPNRVRPYLSENLFDEFFMDEYSLAIREGRMVSNKYAIETKYLSTIENKFLPDDSKTISFKVKALEKVTSNGEIEEAEKTITTTWNYSDKDNPFVVDVNYNE